MRTISILALGFALLATGCAATGQKLRGAGYDAVDRVPASSDGERHIVRINPQVLGQLASNSREAPSSNPELAEQMRAYSYRVGPQDVLIFTVWDHPELTIPAGEFRDAEIQGHLVGPDGRIFFPYVGYVDVRGRTLSDIRTQVADSLARYISNPQLDVRVADFRSQKVNISGEVREPGVLPLTDVPLTLIEALALSGGATPEAGLQRVQVVRGGEVRTFDLFALLERGDMRQNMLLQDGDVVYVPDSSYYSVHVLGEVATPGAVPMSKGRLNLAEVITSSGGFNVPEANAREVFVFRGSYDRPEVYWLNAKSVDAMLLATQFQMLPQDVVFVSAGGLARWNRLVSLILPTVQTLWQTQSLIEELDDDNE